MSSYEQRTGVEIPRGVSPESIMSSLKIGHGYQWTVLTRHPILIAHGASKFGNMPELLLAGKKSMVIAGGDPVYIARIRSVLEMLQRQSHRVSFSREDV
jgi:hypothetical protein